jgi:hypothetical protein
MKPENCTSSLSDQTDGAEQVDNSDNLDLETVFHAEASSTAEIEALAVKELLESNGIPVIMVGDSVLPNLPFEIKVPRDQAACARQLIAEAQSTGPAAAEAAELEFERNTKSLS